MKTHFNFIVCEKHHTKRTIPLYQTVCKIIIERGDTFSLIGSKQIDDINIIKLCDNDDYKSAINKTLNSIIYHYDNNTPFDYFFLGDDDTYINFTNYDKFIELIKNRTDFEMFGCTGPINGDGRLHVTGGPGWVVNRKTFNIIAEHIKKNYITHSINSDVSVALNIHDYNSKNEPKINFIEVLEFLNPNKPLTDINKLITYHVRDQMSYFDLYREH